jgi:hypothetical protein
MNGAEHKTMYFCGARTVLSQNTLRRGRGVSGRVGDSLRVAPIDGKD